MIDRMELERLLGHPIDRRQPRIVPTSLRSLPSGHLELRFGIGEQDEHGYEKDGLWLLDSEAAYSIPEIRRVLRRWCSAYPKHVVPGPRLAVAGWDQARRDPTQAGGGWLGPHGEWWPCPDARHRQTAERIVIERGLHFGRRDPEFFLEELGWLHIKDNGLVLPGGDQLLTQSQMDRLFDMAQTHSTMREWLMTTLRRQQQAAV